MKRVVVALLLAGLATTAAEAAPLTVTVDETRSANSNIGAAPR
jgi:hypothetical protein